MLAPFVLIAGLTLEPLCSAITLSWLFAVRHWMPIKPIELPPELLPPSASASAQRGSSTFPPNPKEKMLRHKRGKSAPSPSTGSCTDYLRQLFGQLQSHSQLRPHHQYFSPQPSTINTPLSSYLSHSLQLQLQLYSSISYLHQSCTAFLKNMSYEYHKQR